MIAMPTACPLCGLRSRGGDLCPGCLSDVAPGVPGAGRCLHCAVALGLCKPDGRQPRIRCDECDGSQSPGRSYDRTIAVIDYTYPGDMLISALKEHGRLDVAAMLGRLIAKATHAPRAGLPRLGIHGLRKLAATRLADAGCSTHEIAAITGHRAARVWKPCAKCGPRWTGGMQEP